MIDLRTKTPLIGLIMLVLAGLACQTLLGADETPTPEPAVAIQSEEDEPEVEESETAEANQPAVPAVALAEPFQVEAGGFSFRPPADYSVSADFGFASVEAPDADSDLGPAILMFSDEEDESLDLDALFELAVADVDVPIVNEGESTVAGAPARFADFEGQADQGEEAHGRMIVVLIEPGRVFSLLASAPVDQWSDFVPVVDAVIDTLTFFEPLQTEVAEEPEEAPEVAPDEELPASEEPGEEIRQWASGASASSEFGSPDWGALQATGEPDSDGCGDQITAWASAEPDGYDWLEVTFDTPVVPTEINIHQSFNPDQVSSVELLDEAGNYREVYFEVPSVQECPYVLTVPVADASYRVTGVRIWVDQGFLTDLSWNEIDAVELVGFVDDSPAPVFETPAGFRWRAGGESNPLEGNFAALGGMDVDPESGLLYVADNLHGVYVLDESGAQVGLLENDDFNNPSDVKVGPDGNLYVASWGSNQIFVLGPDGEQLLVFGEAGTGDGQFGDFSPQQVTVGLDGRIYVLDDNEDENGESYERVQVFSAEGLFLFEILIEDDFVVPSDLEIGPDGDLYLLGFFSDSILKYTPDGEFIEELGAEALEFRSPQKLAIDQNGNFYATTWSEDPVVKLDPDGVLIATFGVDVEDGEVPWPEGAFYSADGIAVQPDGSMAYVSEWSGQLAYVTAFVIE